MPFDPYAIYKMLAMGRIPPTQDDPGGDPRGPHNPNPPFPRPKPPRPADEYTGKGSGDYTGDPDLDYRKIEEPPDYPGPDGTEEQKHAWKQWVQRKEAWQQGQLDAGKMPYMKTSDYNMRAAYGDSYANVDLKNHKIWDTRTDEAGHKGGYWRDMTPDEWQAISDYRTRHDTPEGAKWENAWGGNSYLADRMRQIVKTMSSNPHSSMFTGSMDPRFHVYWDRGAAQKGDYKNYKYYDEFGRETQMPTGFYDANLSGMDPNRYYLNAPGSSDPYPQPGNNTPLGGLPPASAAISSAWGGVSPTNNAVSYRSRSNARDMFGNPMDPNNQFGAQGNLMGLPMPQTRQRNPYDIYMRRRLI